MDYRPQIWTFINNREVGEVVFTIRMAYQATNNPRNSGFGSLYSDICVFAADITRERHAIAARKQADLARKRQAHRLELQDAREHAAAQALSSLKRSGNKVRRVFYFHQLGLIYPVKAKAVVAKPTSNSSDSHNLSFSEAGSSVDSDPAPPANTPKDDSSSEDESSMMVDSVPEARF